ncbi:uncharacterized protein TNCV_469221 [Trichonephila clavipes]|nr:uncharacterized protein TNCV_469221 [Trichonephila clavipes]
MMKTPYELASQFLSHKRFNATRGLLATDHVILNHGQVTWTTPELAPPLLTTTPHQREDVSALDRFNVHRCPTRWIFSGTGLELVTRQATVRYLYHSATTATLGDDTLLPGFVFLEAQLEVIVHNLFIGPPAMLLSLHMMTQNNVLVDVFSLMEAVKCHTGSGE